MRWRIGVSRNDTKVGTGHRSRLRATGTTVVAALLLALSSGCVTKALWKGPRGTTVEEREATFSSERALLAGRPADARRTLALHFSVPHDQEPWWHEDPLLADLAAKGGGWLLIGAPREALAPLLAADQASADGRHAPELVVGSNEADDEASNPALLASLVAEEQPGWRVVSCAWPCELRAEFAPSDAEDVTAQFAYPSFVYRRDEVHDTGCWDTTWRVLVTPFAAVADAVCCLPGVAYAAALLIAQSGGAGLEQLING